MIRKLTTLAAGLMFAAALGVEIAPPSAYAAKVDCSKVMSELNAGKKASVAAKDLGISTSSVYRCKKKNKLAANKETASKNSTASLPANSSTTKKH